MKLFYDLHIHSCLSPCGDNDMTPNNIVNMAKLLGLDVIAVSDHNCALNLPAVQKVARKNDMLVIPAIELNTAEEVHVLTLFYSFEQALNFSDYIYGHLPDIENKPEIFGEQLILDENDEATGTVDKLLINALDLGLDALCGQIGSYGGVMIPAHINKSAYSLISNLGFIPPEYGFKCVEVNSPDFKTDFEGNIISDSDAHYLEHINERVNYLEAGDKTIESVINSIIGKNK